MNLECNPVGNLELRAWSAALLNPNVALDFAYAAWVSRSR